MRSSWPIRSARTSASAQAAPRSRRVEVHDRRHVDCADARVDALVPVQVDPLDRHAGGGDDRPCQRPGLTLDRVHRPVMVRVRRRVDEPGAESGADGCQGRLVAPFGEVRYGEQHGGGSPTTTPAASCPGRGASGADGDGPVHPLANAIGDGRRPLVGLDPGRAGAHVREQPRRGVDVGVRSRGSPRWRARRRRRRGSRRRGSGRWASPPTSPSRGGPARARRRLGRHGSRKWWQRTWGLLGRGVGSQDA